MTNRQETSKCKLPQGERQAAEQRNSQPKATGVVNYSFMVACDTSGTCTQPRWKYDKNEATRAVKYH